MSHLLPGSLAALADTTIGTIAINDVVTWNGISWINSPTTAATTFLVQGEGTNPFTVSNGDTLDFSNAASPNNAFAFDTSVADKVSLGWANAPTTGGTTEQVLIFDDTTDTYSWGSPISIAPASSTYLSFDNDTRQLSVSNLLITDVTVDGVSVSITAYVATVPNHQAGDVVILTNATGGSQTWIHNGGSAGTIADYNQILDGASMSTFNVAGNTGTPQAITEGNTMTISGGAGLTTTASATDTLTIDFSAQPTTGGSTQQVLQFNDAGDTYSWVDITTLESVTASNGLNRIGDNIQLGGTLTQDTIVSGGIFFLDILTTTGGINFSSTSTGAITFDAPTANVILQSGTKLQFNNPADTFNTTFVAGVMTADIDYTLPIVAPTVGQVLSSDASGVLSWTTSTADNIYITDGTLTGNRIVSMGTSDLTFSGSGGDFTVSSTESANHSITTSGTGTISLTNVNGDIDVVSITGNVTVGPTGTASLVHLGTQNFPVAVKTASYTMVEGDYCIIADGNAAIVTITTPATPAIGDLIQIKAVDITNAVTVTTPVADKIDGVDTHTFLLAQESITLIYSDVNNWRIL